MAELTEEENQYIRTSAKSTISAAINVLNDLNYESLKEMMSLQEYSSVMNTLHEWRERLYRDTRVL